MEELFEGIYSNGRNVYTKNMVKGKKVYGEKLLPVGSDEYREWNPYRSKYCAAIKKGLKESIFFSGARVLYLGSAEGTSVSHVSDIVGTEGEVFGVDISETATEKLLLLVEQRKNIFPIIGDAQMPVEYEKAIGGKIDALFQDVSQRNQAEIFARNSVFLKKGSLGALAIKIKSISQTESTKKILSNERKTLEKEFKILQTISLEPYSKNHYLFLVRKK